MQAAEPPPWGFWLTLAWSIVALVAALVVQTMVAIVFIAARMLGRPAAEFEQMAAKLEADGLLLSMATIAACAVVVSILGAASRLRGHHVGGYLGLKPLKRRETMMALGSVALFILAADLVTWGAGHEVVPEFIIEAYETAVFLPLFVGALVIAAPFSEELAFRGFIFRGLSASWLGAPGTVVITSLCWALLHLQYGWYHIGIVFLSGLLLGYWRWRSGSTSLTILMHSMMNAVATIETAIAVEVLGRGAH